MFLKGLLYMYVTINYNIYTICIRNTARSKSIPLLCTHVYSYMFSIVHPRDFKDIGQPTSPCTKVLCHPTLKEPSHCLGSHCTRLHDTHPNDEGILWFLDLLRNIAGAVGKCNLIPPEEVKCPLFKPSLSLYILISGSTGSTKILRLPIKETK